MKTRLQNLMSIGMLFVATFSFSQTIIVNSLAQLKEVIQNSNQEIVMTAGEYNLEDLNSSSRVISFSGSNNTINLNGVHIKVPVGSIRESYILVQGNHNIINGGEIEDVYRSGITEITDFVAYHQDAANLAYGLKGAAVMTVSGEDNLVDGIKLTVRGSHLYGYGSMYGINQYNTFGNNKRCGLLINGARNTLDNVEVQMRAFGHGIYMQGEADKTVIKNTLVEGRVRAYAELYEETDPNSFPYRSDYKLPETSGTDYDMPFSSSVQPIPTDQVFSLSEDGIRAYTGTGSVTVENCTVKKMRGGFRLYLGAASTVTNSIAVDCGSTNYNMATGSTITNSSGNFSYAPLSDFRLSRSSMNIEWTIIPSPHATGPHNIADVLGNNHNIVFHRTPGPIDTTTRAIVVTGSNSTIVNETEYPIVFESTATGNTLISCGGATITDNGTNNTITEFDTCEEAEDHTNTLCPKTAALMEAECYDAMSGIRTENTGDTGGGLNIGYIENNDWIQFDDIDISGMNSINARNSGKSNGSTIEVRLDAIDGDLIAIIPVTNTGGWQNWVTNSVDLENSVEGIHDVFFVFKSTSTGSVFNVNWLGFSSEQLSIHLNSLNDYGVDISPNPIKNEFNIDLANSSFKGDVNVCLYNVKGEKLLETKVSSTSTTTLDVANLSSGVYFLRVHDQNKVVTGKVIKK